MFENLAQFVELKEPLSLQRRQVITLHLVTYLDIYQYDDTRKLISGLQ